MSLPGRSGSLVRERAALSVHGPAVFLLHDAPHVRGCCRARGRVGGLHDGTLHVSEKIGLAPPSDLHGLEP